MSNKSVLRLEIQEICSQVLKLVEAYPQSGARAYTIRTLMDCTYYALRLCRFWVFTWPWYKSEKLDDLVEDNAMRFLHGGCPIYFKARKLGLIIEQLPRNRDTLSAMTALKDFKQCVHILRSKG